MKTTDLKPEFKEKLIRHHAYKKYVRNFKNNHPDWDLSEMNDSVSFASFLRRSFGFDDTPEGFDYWWDLSEK
jgi:hypothetical protein